MDKTLFDKYKAELEEELKIDELNLKEIQQRLPSNRHKWVSRLIEQKYEMSKLKALRKEAIVKLIEKLNEQELVALSMVALQKKAEQQDIIKKIDEEISSCENLILYLEKVEVVYKSTTFDVKNLIDIMKMELT